MPEGDTIHRTAARLRPALVGAELVRFHAPRLAGPRPRSGETVGSVDAVGKHLLVRFSGGITLQTHMRMTGSWHLYRTGERWRKPAHLARCVLEVRGWTAVCFSAPVVRTFPTATEGTSADPLASLGPDLAAPAADGSDGPAGSAGSTKPAPDVVAACLERMAALGDPAAAIGDVLLDQRLGNGIGNVYRSEVCWACGVSPFRPLQAVTSDVRSELLVTAGRLLQANLGRADRTTVPGGLAVYGRRGRPCRRCGTAVRSRHAGAGARIVYWCPTCQPD
jgi:endonuclease VIII